MLMICVPSLRKELEIILQRSKKTVNELRKTTLTTLEVAEMMEVSHNDVLRKIEGRKDRKGYILSLIHI